MRNATRLTGAVVLGMAAGAALGRWSAAGRYSFAGRTVIITGGSRGLGLLLARQLAREGAHLALLARNEAELNRAVRELATTGAQVLPVRCDVRNQGEVNATVERVQERFGRIDVLINNAGIIQVGPLEHLTVQDFADALAVHLYGPLFATLAVWPRMRELGGGRIVNISSIGGKIAVPHLLPYSASKFALTGLSDGLRSELGRYNIRVTTVCPGLMRTGSPPNAKFKGQHRREYAWFAVSDAMPVLSMNGERAASKIIAACRRGSPRLVLGMHSKAAVVLNELFPGLSGASLALANQLLPEPDPAGGIESHTGWESQSRFAPSVLTRLSDQATSRNNERPA